MASIGAAMGAFCATLLLLFPTSCGVTSDAGASSGCESMTGVAYRTFEIGVTNAVILALLAGSAAATFAAMVRIGRERARRKTLDRKVPTAEPSEPPTS